MALINTETVLLDMTGKDIVVAAAQGDKPEPLTLKTVLVQSLISGGENVNSKDKIDRYALALRVKDGGEIDIDAEEMPKKSYLSEINIDF